MKGFCVSNLNTRNSYLITRGMFTGKKLIYNYSVAKTYSGSSSGVFALLHSYILTFSA